MLRFEAKGFDALEKVNKNAGKIDLMVCNSDMQIYSYGEIHFEISL